MKQQIIPPQRELKQELREAGAKSPCPRCGTAGQRFGRKCPSCGRRYRGLAGGTILGRLPGRW